MGSKDIICDKCEGKIRSKGLRIVTTDTGKDLIFCPKCIKNGMHFLSIKKDKSPDEVRMLAHFRTWLKNEEIN